MGTLVEGRGAVEAEAMPSGRSDHRGIVGAHVPRRHVAMDPVVGARSEDRLAQPAVRRDSSPEGAMPLAPIAAAARCAFSTSTSTTASWDDDPDEFAYLPLSPPSPHCASCPSDATYPLDRCDKGPGCH